MTPERWKATAAYSREVFGREDPFLASLMPQAIQAGLPDIAVSADVGRLLSLVARLAADGRSFPLALELGTLAGYSAIWITRGLGERGRLITVEPEPRHADFAQRMFGNAGLGSRIEIRREKAIEVLESLGATHAEQFDLIFFDALKTEYPRYFALAHPLLRPGGLLVADNALGSGGWWIDTPRGVNENRDAVDRLNREIAAHPDYDAAVVPIREGVMIARKKNVSPMKGD